MTLLTISLTAAMLPAFAYEHSDRGQCTPRGTELWKWRTMEDNAVRKTELYRNQKHR